MIGFDPEIALALGSFSKFSDNPKLCGKVNELEGRDAIQRDLDKLERPVCAHVVKLSKAKYKILHLELEQSQEQIQAGRRMD